ncbi:MAG: DUF4416 family protein [Fibrobacterota bacterium]
MGIIKKTAPVKLICGFIYHDKEYFIKSLDSVKALFGKTDYESPELVFDKTSYYDREFGKGLFKKFISFEKLIDRTEITEVKIKTNLIEKELSTGNKRTVNLDPGYLTLGQLILATTKDREHRIYVGKGIFCEVTLTFRDGEFIPYPWTYADYASLEYRDVLKKIRQLLREQMKKRIN